MDLVNANDRHTGPRQRDRHFRVNKVCVITASAVPVKNHRPAIGGHHAVCRDRDGKADVLHSTNNWCALYITTYGAGARLKVRKFA